MIGIQLPLVPEEKPAFDCVGAIMEFEQGDLDADGIIALFSHLIETGLAWSLQGSYGRLAKSLIERGYIDRKGKVLKHVEAA